MNSLKLQDPVENLPYVGPIYAKRLAKLKISTIEDLIEYFPFRYNDFSVVTPIARVQPGETITVKAKIDFIKNEYTKNGKKIQKALVSDQSGSLEIIWFNQPFLTRVLKPGEWFNFSGTASWFGRKIVLISPEYELQKPSVVGGQPSENIHTGRLVPVYSETYGVSSKWLRTRIKTALNIFGNQLEEFLPPEIVNQNNLASENEALHQIHFPDTGSSSEKARQRLAFDELFLIQLSARLRKTEWQNKFKSQKIFSDGQKISEFVEKLPFKLTSSQETSFKEILADLAKEKPMNRLLEGDVGSGKTVVAAIGMYSTFLKGLCSIIMAPTEILANQHYQTLTALLSPFGIKVELITGSHKNQSSVISHQSSDIIVGTHALLFRPLPKNIGLIVIDEQHRFGVEQRAKLLENSSSKKKIIPHLLTMTATPIPRTVALTLYGDLDLSLLKEMPAGRLKIKTWVVPSQKRADAYIWLKNRVKGTQEQAFIICPLIEDSETLASAKAAKSEYERLVKEVFPDLRLGLIHGKMKSAEKEQVLELFRQGELDVLVATPVVEVGLDIPNATVMLIESADRFGLAQLHQLRGRVGRRNLESFCLLFAENEESSRINRLKNLEKIYCGTELAEIDLRLRGPGEIYGTKQHGIPDLRVASFTDLNLIERTRNAAISLTTNHPARHASPAGQGLPARLPSEARRPGALSGWQGEAGRQPLITNPTSLLNQKLKKYTIREVVSN